MDQRETVSSCGVLDEVEVAVLATGPEPAAFTCEPIGFRLVQRPVAEADPAPAPEPITVEAPAPAPVQAPVVDELEPPPAPYFAADEDEQDDPVDREDDVVRRPARIDPRLTDPDTLERAKRVEVYRVMIEQDPQVSIFNRQNSPPRRVLPAPRTL